MSRLRVLLVIYERVADIETGDWLSGLVFLYRLDVQSWSVSYYHIGIVMRAN